MNAEEFVKVSHRSFPMGWVVVTCC